jgi:ribonuclease HI
MIEVWIDGLCEPTNPGGTACFGCIIKRNGETIDEGYGAVGSGEDMTNNVAEYTALVRALKKIRELELDKEKIVLRGDSELVIYGIGIDPRIGRSWKVKSSRLIPLLNKAKILAHGMDITYEWIPRWKNREADELSRVAYKPARALYLKSRKESKKLEKVKLFEF